jgi:hypothetical protein
MILDSLVGLTGLLALLCHCNWPAFITGLVFITYWQWKEYGKDERIYPTWWYGFTGFAIEWGAGAIMYSFIFWAIAWGFGLR